MLLFISLLLPVVPILVLDVYHWNYLVPLLYKGSTLEQIIIIFSTMTYPNARLDLSRQQFSLHLFLMRLATSKSIQFKSIIWMASLVRHMPKTVLALEICLILGFCLVNMFKPRMVLFCKYIECCKSSHIFITTLNNPRGKKYNGAYLNYNISYFTLWSELIISFFE